GQPTQVGPRTRTSDPGWPAPGLLAPTRVGLMGDSSWRKTGGRHPGAGGTIPLALPNRGNDSLGSLARCLVTPPAMSQPRQIVPGTTYLITRRILRRHLLLRPDAAITQLLVYALGVSTRRFGVEVHALCAMSTHLHLVVTDEQGVLPRFLQFFHRLVALGTKVLRKWEGPVWDHEATSVVQILTPAAVVEKIAYVLANPVSAGLVRHAREWPGAKVDVSEIGRG